MQALAQALKREASPAARKAQLKLLSHLVAMGAMHPELLTGVGLKL